ncbi:hypothetical protein RND71_009840 [Anisodus tanguticus]|uniref:Uncharacterized protein n=1 Tax=Anisodus tanguticus TaxID=243964 RepID=A0AAE1SI29_9SOLA|nr:hypothetical protein RND71_009840 [Anisodus tanguticus]
MLLGVLSLLGLEIDHARSPATRAVMEVPHLEVGVILVGVIAPSFKGSASEPKRNHFSCSLFPRSTSTPYRVWFSGMQVGGWTQVYGDMLSFATIRGASHEVPFSQQERSLVLIKSFLEGKTFPEAF